MKILKRIIIIVIIIVMCIIFLAFLPWMMLFLSATASPHPGIPEIKTGEFPFKLEYEINGETVIVEDTLICKYDGVGIITGYGKYRKWKGSLSNGQEDVLLIQIDANTKIFYPVGPPGDYMGELAEGKSIHFQFPNGYYVEKDDNGKIINDKIINEEELLEKYKIKLMDWKYTSPIENTFK